jgi:transcriptional regulator with XRE-family HTH domain
MIMKTIRECIKKRGISRYKISQDTGVDQAQLCRVMQGKTITAETADVLLKYFGFELIRKARKTRKEGGR